MAPWGRALPPGQPVLRPFRRQPGSVTGAAPTALRGQRRGREEMGITSTPHRRRRSPERETDRQSREPRSGPRRRTLRSRGLGERCRRGRPAEEAPGSGQAGETGCSSSQALSCFEPLVSGAVNGLPSPARSPYALAKDQEIKKKKKSGLKSLSSCHSCPESWCCPRAAYLCFIVDVPRERNGVIRDLLDVADGVEAFFVIGYTSDGKEKEICDFQLPA